MAQPNQKRLTEILENYHREVRQLRDYFSVLGGCVERAERMKADFAYNGADAEIIVATTGSSELTHESNVRWHYHHIIHCNGLVWDPNYSGKAPIPLEEYAKTVFLEKDIYLWRKGDKSKPIWQSV